MQNQEKINSALRAADNPILLENEKNLAIAASQWSQAAILGIDTEFLRERTYRAELGLVQVSDGRTAWLVDVTRIANLDALRHLFENPEILKVFHSASEDFEVLWNTLAVLPNPVIDTQIACAMLGHPLQMSYHNAIKWLTGIEVDKDQTRSNWLRRPLNSRQLHYAATDVVFLPLLCRQVRERLQTEDKWHWLEEDVEQLLEQSQESVKPQEAYLRLGGATNLDAAELRVLRELAAWREQTAIERNLARGFVVRDPILMQAARQQPNTISELASLDEIHEKSVQRFGKHMLEAIKKGLESQNDAPAPEHLNGRQKKLMSEMRKLVLAEAQNIGIDPALLASKKVLESLLRAVEMGESLPKRLSGWRDEIITQKLVAIIKQGC